MKSSWNHPEIILNSNPTPARNAWRPQVSSASPSSVSKSCAQQPAELWRAVAESDGRSRAKKSYGFFPHLPGEGL